MITETEGVRKDLILSRHHRYTASIAGSELDQSTDTPRQPHVAEFEPPIPATTEQLPPFVYEDPERLARLERVYLNMVRNRTEGEPYSEETLRHLYDSASLRLILWEINLLTAPRTTDVHRRESREHYLDTILDRPTSPFSHKLQQQAREKSQAQYVHSVMDYITEILDANTPEEMLAVRELPSLCERTRFTEDWPSTLEDLAANHLALLLDTMLKEHVPRREYIDAKRRHSRFARVANSRGMRTLIVFGVFGLTIAPHTGLVPIDHEYLAEEAGIALRTLSAVLIAVEAPELARYMYWDRKHKKETKSLVSKLKDEEAADIALRIMYNSTRYGTDEETGQGFITGRTGTPDEETNMERFRLLDQEFPHLNNDPGGKPYSGDQALGYAGRLLFEHKTEVDKILDLTQKPEVRRQLYLNLCETILNEDLARMYKGLTEFRTRKIAVNILVVPLAAKLSGLFAPASEVKTLYTDATNGIKHEAGIEEED